MKYKIVLLGTWLALLFMASCGQPDDPQPHPLEGEYILKSLYSDTQVDMDFDGNYDTDWLREFKKVAIMKNNLMAFLYERQANDNKVVFFVEFEVPMVIKPPSRFNLDDLIRYDWGLNDFVSVYNDRTRIFESIILSDQVGQYVPPPAYIEAMRVTENKELHLRIRHEGVFDKKDNTWNTAYLDAVFAWHRPFNH